MYVIIVNSFCGVVISSEISLICVLDDRLVGIYSIILYVKGKGLFVYFIFKVVIFVYEIFFFSVLFNDCGFGGGRVVFVKGYGFDLFIIVKICDVVCVIINSLLNEIYCEVFVYIV